MDKRRFLLFVPTYNERDNIRPLFAELTKLGLPMDILFLDDNSPDGTGEIMDQIAQEHPHVSVIHRTGKLGIGSAHKEGISWAYEHRYRTLVTMDADFTHSPSDIPVFLAQSEDHEVVLGSRYMREQSLKGWNPMRKFLTRFGHLLTITLLGLKYDCTGAFRVYRLDRIPERFLALVRSNGYSFFFESLFVLNQNRFRIAEVPIVLPPRTYGHSKMSYVEVYRSVRQLFDLCWRRVFNPKSWRLEKTGFLRQELA